MTENKSDLKTIDGKAFDIPEGGSLGLLALGYRGLMMWRQKRNELTALRKKQLQDLANKDEKK